MSEQAKKERHTEEFVVENGSDSELWGDIDSPADEAWADMVNQSMQKSGRKRVKVVRKQPKSSENQ